jgi:AcrR family transcriptional regulator
MSQLEPTTEVFPRQLRADARRNRARVLEAAKEAFEAEGLAVNVDVIARRAGVGVGTVYRHFPTKELLFEAIVLTTLEAFVEEARALADAEDAGEALYGFLERTVDQSDTSMAIKDALAGACFDVTATAASTIRDLELALGHLLERAQQAGATRTDIGVAELFALVGACHAAQPAAGSTISRRHLVRVICDGLRPPQPRNH